MDLYDRLKNGIYFIAEMSANHAGKLENALEIVRQAKKAGADCVKIQTYTADTLTLDCKNEHFRIKNGLWSGRYLYELYQEAGTPWEWHQAIREECEKEHLDFLSTPFDKSAVDFLETLGVSFYKVASFELVDIPLIEYIASKGKPIIMSCGMGSAEEIQDAVDACRRQENYKTVLLKCCSEYPANFSDMNLATIADMKQRYKVPVGLSDHSPGTLGAVVGACLGAAVIEKHFCLSREIESADSAFSMEPQEYKQMVCDVKNALRIQGQVTYELTEKEKDSAAFRRSLFAVKDICAGERFTEDNVRSVRPAEGLAPRYLSVLLGKKASYSYKKGEPISADELIMC